MLINCPECSKQISDKAESCPNCGLPMQKKRITRKNASKPHKYHRLENGFGNIKHLTGNRRKPYAAYSPTKEYDDNGNAINKVCVGYFETWQQAYEALAECNRNGGSFGSLTTTFAEVYSAYYINRFEKGKGKNLSDSYRYCIKSAYDHLKPLHDMKYSEITADDMQAILDKSTLKHASQEYMVTLLRQMDKYALERNIISKGYSEFVKISTEKEDEKGVPFTEDDIKLFWSHKDDEVVQVILILIYSGFRIKELETVRIEDGCFIGGLKTKSGINRIVPIHSAIKDYVGVLEGFKAPQYRSTKFYPMMKKLGLEKANSGARHTPHDCRHTFSWLADKYEMDSISKHMIMGHSLGSDVENNVYGHRTVDELKTAMDKIKVPIWH